MKRDWTQEEIKLLKEKYSTEISREDLCKLFDRLWGSVEWQARKLQLKRPGRPTDARPGKTPKWPKAEIELLKKIYPDGDLDDIYMSFPARTNTAVRVKAKKLKLKRIINIQRNTDFTVLLKDDPISFYWIGFLLADGCINFKDNSLNLRISVKDTKHAKKFANFIKSKVNFWEGWYYSSLLGGWSYARVATVRGCDKDNVPLIAKKFDWKKRKTYNPPDTSKWKFEDDLLFSLIIGFIDGDGDIGRNGNRNGNRKGSRVRIRCHESWLKFMEFLDNEVHRILDLKKERDYWCLIPKTKDRPAQAKVAWFKHVINCGLKKKVLELKLPVLSRKWDQIDHTLIGDK